MKPKEPNKRRQEPHHRAVDSRPPSEAGCGVTSTRGCPLVVNYGENGLAHPSSTCGEAAAQCPAEADGAS